MKMNSFIKKKKLQLMLFLQVQEFKDLSGKENFPRGSCWEIFILIQTCCFFSPHRLLSHNTSHPFFFPTHSNASHFSWRKFFDFQWKKYFLNLLSCSQMETEPTVRINLFHPLTIHVSFFFLVRDQLTVCLVKLKEKISNNQFQNKSCTVVCTKYAQMGQDVQFQCSSTRLPSKIILDPGNSKSPTPCL